MKRSIDVHKQFGTVSSSLGRMRWVSASLLTISITRREAEGVKCSMCYYNQTHNLTEFENIAFQDTRFAFLNTVHILLTLDHELFGM